jgi:hypothetical protein
MGLQHAWVPKYYPPEVPKFNFALGPEMLQTGPDNFHTYYCFGCKITWDICPNSYIQHVLGTVDRACHWISLLKPRPAEYPTEMQTEHIFIDQATILLVERPEQAVLCFSIQCSARMYFSHVTWGMPSYYVKDYRRFSKVIWKDRNLRRLYVQGKTTEWFMLHPAAICTRVCTCWFERWLILEYLDEKLAIIVQNVWNAVQCFCLYYRHFYEVLTS